MTNKFNSLSILTLGVCLLTTANTHAVETLTPEDEAFVIDDVLIKDVKRTNHIAPNRPITSPASLESSNEIVLPASGQYAYPANAPRKIEWFAPNALPTNQAHEINTSEVDTFKAMINDCIAIRKDKLDLEREMFEEDKSPQNAAYLSQTFADINLCYTDIGYNIIETFYNQDANTLADFTNKAKTFYVRGTAPSFDINYCGETCSMNAIIEAQMVKFAEFRLYLTKLLEERPVSE